MKIYDERGRVVAVLKDGKLYISRYPDMTNKMKKALIDIYKELPVNDLEIDEQNLIQFLNYDNDEEFCS